MEKSIGSKFLVFVLLTVLMSGCASAPTPIPHTFSPSPMPPTFTPEPTSIATQSQITIIEAPGNLESTQDIGCVPISDLKNTYTPPDLYNGMTKCMNQDNYSSAVFFFALAGTYAYYDTLRVADITAHDAKSVLIQQNLNSLDEKQKDMFGQELQNTFQTPEYLPALCDELLRIGAPQYYPHYMIQHGMNAIIGGNPEDELVKNFDSDTAWKKARDDYVHCSNPTPSPITPTFTPDPNATPIPMARMDVPIIVGDAKILIVMATNDPKKISDPFFIDITHSPEETTLYVEAQIVSGNFDPFADGISLTDENGKPCPRGSTSWVDIVEFKNPYWEFTVPKASKSFTLHFPDGQLVKLDLILEMVP